MLYCSYVCDIEILKLVSNFNILKGTAAAGLYLLEPLKERLDFRESNRHIDNIETLCRTITPSSSRG